MGQVAVHSPPYLSPCGCGDNLFVLSSFPVHADEKINLKGTHKSRCRAQWMAAASKKHGGWENRPVSVTEVLVQELSRHGDSG